MGGWLIRVLKLYQGGIFQINRVEPLFINQTLLAGQQVDPAMVVFVGPAGHGVVHKDGTGSLHLGVARIEVPTGGERKHPSDSVDVHPVRDEGLNPFDPLDVPVVKKPGPRLVFVTDYDAFSFVHPDGVDGNPQLPCRLTDFVRIVLNLDRHFFRSQPQKIFSISYQIN